MTRTDYYPFKWEGKTKDRPILCPIGPTGDVRLRDVQDPDDLIEKRFVMVQTRGSRWTDRQGFPLLPQFHHVTKWNREEGKLYYSVGDGCFHAVYVGKSGETKVYVSPMKLVKK